MIVSIMQPYFFPYIGYFQLLACSDIFVIYDDIQYMKGGWINRNRILHKQNPRWLWLTFPVQSASLKLFINQRYYVENQDERKKILNSIAAIYKKAPYFLETYSLLLEIMSFESNNVSVFNINLIKKLANILGIRCKILVSSELENYKELRTLKGQDRVIKINRLLGSTHYINSIGGISLYQEKYFSIYGIKLSFLQPDSIQYSQFTESFVPFLSIIDVLMFCSINQVRVFLNQYQLIHSTEL